MYNKHKARYKYSDAFTLIELIVVVAVIGIISAIILLNIGNWQKQIATTKVKSDLAGAISSLENYRNYNNAYPPSIPSDFTKTDSEITLLGGSMDGGDTFCLSATSTKLSGVNYYVDSSNKAPHTSPSCVYSGTVLSSNKNINVDPLLKTARTCADGINYSVTALTANTATLSSNPTTPCLTAGDEILLINLSGTSSNNTNVGNYETLIVQSISNNIVTFTSNKTKYYGNGATDDVNLGVSPSNQRVMLQRIPTYANFAINSGVTLTSSAWNGVKGGVLYLKVTGTLTVNGTITTNGLGYRGASGGYWYGGAGESYNGGPISQDHSTCTTTGARCAISQNANGGGGGGGGSDRYVDGGTGSAGGAAHAVNGTNGGNGRYNSVISSCNNASRPDTKGLGGVAYGISNLSKIFFGSGGGGNSTVGPSTNPGGTGGGIIILYTGSISVNGQISSNGTDGFTAGQQSSAGAGGSVLINSTNATIGSGLVKAVAGSGGNGTNYVCSVNPSQSGPSSVGRIRITGSVTGTSTPTFSP